MRWRILPRLQRIKSPAICPGRCAPSAIPLGEVAERNARVTGAVIGSVLRAVALPKPIKRGRQIGGENQLRKAAVATSLASELFEVGAGYAGLCLENAPGAGQEIRAQFNINGLLGKNPLLGNGPSGPLGCLAWRNLQPMSCHAGHM